MRIRHHGQKPWIARIDDGKYVVEEGDHEYVHAMLIRFEKRFGVQGEELFRKLSSMLTRAFFIDEGDGVWVHLGSVPKS